MAKFGYERLPDFDDYDDREEDEDYDANKTAPFFPGSASTPRPYGEQIEM